jgi:hypothetical protein|tara:strand:+ start:78 stop:611 length:534 start_codon:yes stop_codon:yes gene_type:complete
MKILFLDHDGVICLAEQWGKRHSKKSKKNGDIFDPFCRKAIKTLNEIIEKTGCEIVISSDWRLYKDLSYMQEMYTAREIVKQPIAYTQVFDVSDEDILEETWEYKDSNQIMARVREKEILSWVRDNPGINCWVAVDDLPMHKLKYFVHTPRPTEGIKQIGIKEKIINILNNYYQEET